jgi:RNA polymerase sigma-70 factor (ECF subfamily)
MKNFEKISDGELIKSVLQNDSEALGELYNRYYKKVFQKCQSLVKDPDEAFDLAQEALIKAFNNLKNFRGDASFSTWLYIITHRHCLESLRKTNKKIVKSLDYTMEDKVIPYIEPDEDSIDRYEMENIMVSLINSLPANEKELLLLKYSEGESIESLQYLFHLSSSAIKMRLKRSKEKLNQLYLEVLTVGLSRAMLHTRA